MRSVLTENLRGGATLGPLLLVFALIAAVIAVPVPAFAVNVSFSIPTKVELKVKADGTVISPSADAWQIRNLGEEPIRISSVSSTGFDDGTTVTATSDSLPLVDSDGTGTVTVSAGKDGASLSSTATDASHPVEIAAGAAAGLAWSARVPSKTKNALGDAAKSLGTVSVAAAPAKTAFAVYSADDGSLDFYKRIEVPKAGDTFEGKAVTEVYTGFETSEYTGTYPNDNCPWFSIAHSVKSVKVIDIIKPKKLDWWFNQFEDCTSFDLGNIDTSQCSSFTRLFSGCLGASAITGLDKWDTSNLESLSATFDGLLCLKEIPGISGWNTSKVECFDCTFFNLPNLEHLDLTGWSTDSLQTGRYFGYYGYPKCRNFQYVKVGAGFGDTAAMIYNVGLSIDTPGYDGHWYALSDGTGYAPADIPSNKADTYYATKALRDAAYLKQLQAADPASWSQADLKLLAQDIEANGTSTPSYAAAVAAMDADTHWTMPLTDGTTLTYRIIGVAHDDLSDGTGKAGLTFQATHALPKAYRMNATNNNAGGWEKSELRQNMNSGEVWGLFGSDFQSRVVAVDKLTQNVGGDDKTLEGSSGKYGSGTSKGYEVSKTSDKLWLPSFHELTGTGWPDYAWYFKEGDQYDYYKKVPVAPWAANTVLANLAKTAAGEVPTGASKYTIPSGLSAGVSGSLAWERSICYDSQDSFRRVRPDGSPSGNWGAASALAVAPAWCF